MLCADCEVKGMVSSTVSASWAMAADILTGYVSVCFDLIVEAPQQAGSWRWQCKSSWQA